MKVEMRPLKKEAAEICSNIFGDMESLYEKEKHSDADRVWKEGVLTLLAKIAFELETANALARKRRAI